MGKRLGMVSLIQMAWLVDNQCWSQRQDKIRANALSKHFWSALIQKPMHRMQYCVQHSYSDRTFWWALTCNKTGPRAGSGREYSKNYEEHKRTRQAAVVVRMRLIYWLIDWLYIRLWLNFRANVYTANNNRSPNIRYFWIYTIKTLLYNFWINTKQIRV